MAKDAQKTVLIGITGCIAAYKTCEIVRGLQRAGCRVKIVMTENATRFVGPTTFRALTGEKVAVSLFDDPADPIQHISLAKEADVFLIAPCTGDVMAKMTTGIADDLLSTTVLATRSPLVIAPAMNVNMWENAATCHNLAVLEERGVVVIPPTRGILACGDEGTGKLAPVDDIVAGTLEVLERRDDLAGKRVLVTAGPTYEAIDPVRYLGNRSSGKMGYAIARAAQRRGADVTLVSGPVALPEPYGVSVVRVESAQEMLAACESVFADADIAIFSAAVSDFRPSTPASRKIKKSDGGMRSIELVENPDILATLAEHKGSTFVVGFAAETHDVLDYAADKLVSKHADLIVANDVSGDVGFGTDENRVWFVTADGQEELPLLSKALIGERLIDKCV